MNNNRKHLFIPDSQVAPGVPIDYLRWIGQYIVDKQPDVVIHAGDFADMPSLSYYDKGKKAMENRRIWADIDAVHHAWDVLNAPLEEYNQRMARNHEKRYYPEKHITLGNHEERILRAVEANAQLDGLLGIENLQLDRYGWQVHEFLKVVEIDGVQYAHFFANPLSGKPWGGQIINRIYKVGGSFTMGHVQTKELGEIHYADGHVERGIVAGACYMHDEDYKGPQGNNHWRGILMKHEVKDGDYDLMEVSLNYLCQKYEGMSLDEYEPKLFAGKR